MSDYVPPFPVLGSVALLDSGTTPGKVPIVPVQMSSMSTPVKAHMDAISACLPDPAAYHTASFFATPAYVDARLATLLGTAPANLDTLEEIATALNNNQSLSTSIAAQLNGKEPTIATGGTAQFWRGDKTWQTLSGLAVSGVWGDLLNKPVFEPLNTLGGSTAVRRRQFHLLKSQVNCNSFAQDVAAWTGLPAQWRLNALYSCRASASLASVAKIGLYTGPGATGTTLLTSTLIGLAVGAVNDYSITSGVKNAVQTSSTVYLNNTIALGLSGNCAFVLDITDLTDN